MNRKIDVRLGAIAAAVIALAVPTAWVTKARASNPSPESYVADYPVPQQSAPPAIETAQASQLQNLQPEYFPGLPTQGAPHQTLTLPRAASQSPPSAALELPRSQGQEGSLEGPTQGRPQTTVGRISRPLTKTDDGFKICASRISLSMKMAFSDRL
jgi:hypothetical protein